MNLITRTRTAVILAVFLTLLVVIAAASLILPRIAGSDGGCWDAALRCDRLNEIRGNHGLRALEQREHLQAVADRWSEHMAATGVLEHNPDLTAQTSSTVGENVGYGETWRDVYDAFMASPAHRANMLDRDWSQVGIGTQRAGGVVWLTIVFRQEP